MKNISEHVHFFSFPSSISSFSLFIESLFDEMSYLCRQMKAAFLIAAPTSGSGKTTVARALMALMVQKGLRVQPFKCGPDYIDTKFHEAVCRRPSVNLDTFMATPEHVRELFYSYTATADVAVIEGMMGLFDGYDHDRGSAAEIAAVLNVPVVLVVDARSAAYSMAALLQGFTHFRKDVRFAGVIFNKVGSERHAQMLREVAADVSLPCLGCILKQTALEQGSRYLGLDFSTDLSMSGIVEVLHSQIEWEKLLQESEIGASEKEHRFIAPHTYVTQPTEISDSTHKHKSIAVARNAESFSFLYQETIDLLRGEGEVCFFDPEREVPELDACSLLYLPGGYPEKHLAALTEAAQTRQCIRDYAEAGGRIVAECGGMMYLCRSIVTDEVEAPMCGVLPYSISARKEDRHLHLGYRQFLLDGQRMHGHEFHYTRFAEPVPSSTIQVYNAKGEPTATAILRQGRVWASYTHLSPQAILWLARH